MNVLIEGLLFLGGDKKLDETGVPRTAKNGAPLHTITAFQPSSGKTVKITVEGEPPRMEVAQSFKAKAIAGVYKDRLWLKAVEITPYVTDRMPSLPPKRPVV